MPDQNPDTSGESARWEKSLESEGSKRPKYPCLHLSLTQSSIATSSSEAVTAPAFANANDARQLQSTRRARTQRLIITPLKGCRCR
ncbi:MAG: hypothetical protein AAFX06_13010, partial [Planctomycetota bacterium]